MLDDKYVNILLSHDVLLLQSILINNPDIANQVTPDGDTLLHLACWQKCIEMMPLLLQYCDNVNIKGCYGRTPLHYAVHEGNSSTVLIYALLLNKGADKTIKDDNGFTAFQWAQIECPEYASSIAKL